MRSVPVGGGLHRVEMDPAEAREAYAVRPEKFWRLAAHRKPGKAPAEPSSDPEVGSHG